MGEGTQVLAFIVGFSWMFYSSCNGKNAVISTMLLFCCRSTFVYCSSLKSQVCNSVYLVTTRITDNSPLQIQIAPTRKMIQALLHSITLLVTHLTAQIIPIHHPVIV